MLYTPLAVDLPTCPQCGHVSKIPAGLFSGKGYCSGPKSAPHKRVRMQARCFEEKFDDGKARVS